MNSSFYTFIKIFQKLQRYSSLSVRVTIILYFFKIKFYFTGGFIEKESLKRKLTCTDDVVKSIEKGQKDSNDFRRVNLNLPPITVFVLKHEETVLSLQIVPRKMDIHNIMSYYNLQNTIDATDISGLFNII